MKAIGPTVPRMALGEQLAKAREQAQVTLDDAAAALDCTVWKIRQIESGKTGLRKLEFDQLVELYGLDDDTRARLDQIRGMGRRRGWYVKHGGRLKPQEGQFLGIESAAIEIRTWQSAIVPGLLQTEAYARAVAIGAGATEEQADEYARIRMERQKLAWTDPAPSMWVVLDESALRRTLGDPEMMADQLGRLLDAPPSCHIQVLPADAPPHPGLAGSLTLFRFDPEMHTPIAFTETFGGVHYLEEDYDRHEARLLKLSAMAASLSRSRTMIRDTMDDVLASH